MANMSMTTFAEGLKRVYSPEKIKALTYEANPLYALVKKENDFYGASYVVTNKYANVQGTSATFSNAQSNITSTKMKKFILTRVKHYTLGRIENEVLRAAKRDIGAFNDTVSEMMTSLFETEASEIGIQMFGSGSGSRGQIGSISTDTITLKEVEDVVKFEVGQTLVLNDTDNATSIRTGTITLSAIDRDAGTITATGNITAGISAAANDDYIFIQGDADAVLTGIRGWAPDTAPTSEDSFFSVDRSADPTRLAGIRFDASSYPREEGLIEAGKRAQREGAKLTHCFMSVNKFAELQKELGSKAIFDKSMTKKDDYQIGFNSIKVHMGNNIVHVLADRNCPDSRAFALNINDVVFKTLEGAPIIVTNLDKLDVTNEDSIEIRVGWYGNLYVKDTRNIVNIQLD